MKKVSIIIVIFFIHFHGDSQLKRWIQTANRAPIVSYKSTAFIFDGIDTVSIHTLSAAISLTDGEFDMVDWNGVPITTTWEYISAPFLGLEYNLANSQGKAQLFKANDGASALMLSLGVTGGYGGSFLIIPLGINGTLGVSTDFRDLYAKYGLGYDMWGFTIGVSGFLNLTNNNESFYKSEPGVELKYIWNWD